MLQGNHDFVINDNINVEVKTIHDKLTDEEINQSTNTLQKTLSIGYTMNDIKREISFQLVRKKWIDHLNKAINDQKGKIIFISVTQSPKLYDVILFLEEKEMKKSFKYIINRAIEFLSEEQVIPIIVMLESIYKEYITNYFIFKAPVKYNKSNLILDMNKYTNDYIVKNLVL